MKKIAIGLAMCVSGIGASEAQTVGTAVPPPLIPFSGTMTDVSGAPLVGTVSTIFALYEEAAGGVPLWVDIQALQVDPTGGYLALLGAGTALPVSLFASNQALWLGVQPEGHGELPRTRFFSVPYALKAGDADTLGGRSVSEFVLFSEFEDGEGSVGAAAADAAATGLRDGFAGLTTTSDDARITGDAHIDGSAGIGISSGTGANLEVSGGENKLGIFRVTQRATGGAAYGLDIGLSPGTGDPVFSKIVNDSVAEVMRFQRSTGYVGIGTTTPDGELDLEGTTTTAYIKGTAQAAISLVDMEGPTNAKEGRLINNGGTFSFQSVNDARSAVSDKLAINLATGAVTISGDLTVSGNVAAKYQDVAEWVEAVGAPPPGTVVIVDPAGRNRVMTSATPYDGKVLGAVSPQPGLVLGEPGPTKVLVAQSGRVKVKVDASYGAIAAGDLLATSPTPGHAMRSAPLTQGKLSWHRPGTVLGKALEPLRAGRSEILVLITLQ